MMTGVRALYPLTSILSHSCLPNCRPVMKKSAPFSNVCIASVDIDVGQELTINYVHLNLCTRFYSVPYL